MDESKPLNRSKEMARSKPKEEGPCASGGAIWGSCGRLMHRDRAKGYHMTFGLKESRRTKDVGVQECHCCFGSSNLFLFKRQETGRHRS